MNTLKDYISEYLNYCEYRKQLNFKTIKAYKIDLNQYNSFCLDISDPFSKKAVDSYITELFKHYKSAQEKVLPKFKYYAKCMSELKKILDKEIKPLIRLA